MKTLLIAMFILSCFAATSVKAQNKAQQDDNRVIAVAKSDKTLGRTHLIHYKLTNNGTVSMDFTLYKESNDGTWYTTHSLDLRPGGAYDDEGNAVGMTGRYVLFSAPHSDRADFPSYRDIAATQGAPTVAPAAAPSPGAPSPGAPANTSATPPSPTPAPTPGPGTPQGPDPGAPRP